MKKVILSLITLATLGLNVKAQQASADVLTVKEISDVVAVNDTVAKIAKNDTAIVRIGKKDVKVIDHDGGTEIIWGKGKHRKNPDRFQGHWEGIEFGFNSFAKADYGMYAPAFDNFMSLNQGKSLEFDFNFYELNIGLAKNYVGLVSGMGLSFNNYRFQNPFTLKREQNMTVPVALDPENLSKTKLAVSYLTVPLLLEFQIPVNNNEGRLFINGGIVGGVKIGSHTKVKYGDNKEKDRSGFNLNSFNYAATARIGYKDICLFAKYSLTPLFEDDKGPDLTPFTIGISFLN